MSNNKILFDNETLQTMSLFSQITGVPLKDCFYEENRITFVVFAQSIRKALGKDASNIKRLEIKFGKRIRIVEYNEDLIKFVKNMILPFRVDEAILNEDIIILKSDDLKTKSLIIGKNARNLRALESYVKRYFPNLKEIKVE
jgi:N utilization substance protein A